VDLTKKKVQNEQYEILMPHTTDSKIVRDTFAQVVAAIVVYFLSILINYLLSSPVSWVNILTLGLIFLFIITIYLMYRLKKAEENNKKIIEIIKKGLDEPSVKKEITDDDVVIHVTDHEEAEKLIGHVLKKTNNTSCIYGLFNKADFPSDIEKDFENFIHQGAKVQIIMPCGNKSIKSAERFFNWGSRHNNVKINDYLQPKNGKPQGDPGIRLIMNSVDESCLIGILHPNSKKYEGIYIKEPTFYKYMSESFLTMADQYKAWHPKQQNVSVCIIP